MKPHIGQYNPNEYRGVMMNETNKQEHGKYTVVGTDVEEVKRLNSQSGLSYNEAKELLARAYNERGTENKGEV